MSGWVLYPLKLVNTSDSYLRTKRTMFSLATRDHRHVAAILEVSHNTHIWNI